jgi:(p)ppGpp synthase/HD superfamily hydrolase
MDGIDVRLAYCIAAEAHEGQLDKAGLPYIAHPCRVAASMDTPDEKIVAFLHDAVEDSPLSLRTLHRWFPRHIVAAIGAITHRKGEARADYYARVRRNPLALRVKVADVHDNMQPARLARLDLPTRERLIAKYDAALIALGVDRA